MNKKLLTWLAVAFIGVTFLLTFIGIFVAGMIMCIIGMIFSLAAIICLLLVMFGKKIEKVATPIETPTA